MVIDHIGIAVKSLEISITHWRKVFGYQQLTDPVVNKNHKVKVVFISKKDSTLIKLIEPLDASSQIYKFVIKGGGLHHLCFRCNNVIKEMDRLNSLGLKTRVKPEPGEAFGNENIAFIYAREGIIVELIDTDRHYTDFISSQDRI